MDINPGWNDERVAILCDGWRKGETASVIAARLNEGLPERLHVSRSAVLGRARRMKLSGQYREKPPRIAPAPKIRPPRAPRVKAETKPQAMRRPPKSANRQPNHSAYQKGNADPKKADAIKSSYAAYGKEIVDSFNHLPDDAIPLIGRPFGSCGWPVGVPVSACDQMCCGHRAIEGKPYCEDHAAIAFVQARDNVSTWMKKLGKHIRCGTISNPSAAPLKSARA
jgi:GcrA cell cycle regulator